MSRNTDQTWAYYIAGRNILLYEVAYGGASSDINTKVRLPEFVEEVTLIYPNENITEGLMFEGTAFIEPFVDVDPNELANNAQPDLTNVPNPTEVSHMNLNRMLSLAVVDYVKSNLHERDGDIQKKEYFMKEFFSKLADSESNKRRELMTFPVSPFALR